MNFRSFMEAGDPLPGIYVKRNRYPNESSVTYVGPFKTKFEAAFFYLADVDAEPKYKIKYAINELEPNEINIILNDMGDGINYRFVRPKVTMKALIVSYRKHGSEMTPEQIKQSVSEYLNNNRDVWEG